MADTQAQALWREDELLAATGGRLTRPVSRVMREVSIDSRSIGDGDVFVAIKGDKMDGHDFAAAALKSGAGVATCCCACGRFCRMATSSAGSAGTVAAGLIGLGVSGAAIGGGVGPGGACSGGHGCAAG